jgi:hypothetical protein
MGPREVVTPRGSSPTVREGASDQRAVFEPQMHALANARATAPPLQPLNQVPKLVMKCPWLLNPGYPSISPTKAPARASK